jgi:hypothetical protein
MNNQEMSDSQQVFISHTYEERGVAAVLQKYIRQAFKEAFPVFAAFDKESIGGGKLWFAHIVENLSRSAVVLVLLSHESRRRQWINFEAGYGGGAGAKVVPVFIRNFSLGKLGYPLAGLQGRSIDDIPSMLADITNTLDIPSERVDTDAYLQEIREAEARLVYKSLHVHPFVCQHSLQFELTNNGNSDIELLMLEAIVPKQHVSRHWPPGTSDFMHFENVRRHDNGYLWFACTSNRGAFRDKKPSLRPILTPAMGTTVAAEMRIAVTQEKMDYPESHRPIYYQIHAVDYPTEMGTTTWADLEFRQA